MRFFSSPLSLRPSQQYSLSMMLILFSIVIVVLTSTATTTSIIQVFAQAQEQNQQQSPILRRQAQNRQHQHQRRYLNAYEEEEGVFVVETTSSSPSSLSSTYIDDNGNDNDNSNNRIHQRTLQESNFCILYQEDIYFNPEDDQNGSVYKWTCQFKDYVDESGTKYPHSVDIEGVNIKEELQQAGAKSGISYLQWKSINDVSIDDMSILLTVDMKNTNISIETPTTPNKNARNLQISATGVKKTLVIRVVGDRVGPSANLPKLYNEIFGGEICLKSQMEACSHGKLRIEPFSGDTKGGARIKNGVVELRITTNPNGKTDKQMENDANAAAAYLFGDLDGQFDLILFAMPSGIVPAFAAYAYIGAPASYYSNTSIENVMVQMHEVGHNIGLQHAGQGEEEYGDPSGYMGYSRMDDPQMCYNAANNYQLGWYSQFSIRPTGSDDYDGTFTISGVAGYNPKDTTKFVSLRLEQETKRTNYYIGFNWKSGVNTGTQEDANKVIIVEKAGASSASEISWKKAALNVGQSYIINNYDGSGRSVTITFQGMLDNDSIIEIIAEASSTSPPTTSPPTISPPTTAPPVTAPLTNIPSAEPSISTISSVPTYYPTYFPTLVTFEPTGCQEASIELIVKTDTHPSQISWRLTEKETDNVIMKINQGDYNVTNATETTSFCLKYGSSYRFKIWDAGEDGLSEGGYYVAYYQDGRNNNIIFNNAGDFGRKYTEIFNVTRTLPTIAPTMPDPYMNVVENKKKKHKLNKKSDKNFKCKKIERKKLCKTELKNGGGKLAEEVCPISCKIYGRITTQTNVFATQPTPTLPKITPMVPDPNVM
mmetsp:Transcript_48415/g.53938  ORF Transcript_48415/g.53938 Transcript_48415/m.53938 type:complete len:824 (+) Transcript_48415:199-2670(+)